MFAADMLAGQVAVVTGGATGIGRAIAGALAACGASVVLAARQADRLAAAAVELSALGPRALAVPTDIAAPEQVKALFKRVDAEFGRVDVLVNNAAANFIQPSETLTPVRWKKVVDIVLNGTFYCSLEAGRRMVRRRSGRIVNLVAAYAWTGAPGLAPSASAKAGVVALTRTLGVEWAEYGVRVNAVCPGLIDTPQSRERLWPQDWMRERLLAGIPAQRFGAESDVADLVLYLASPLSSYMNGTVVVVDGGESLGKGALPLIREAGIIRRARKKRA